MKFLPSQLAYLLGTPENRSNLRSLAKYLLFLGGLIGLYAVTFHVVMLYAEGQRHSWITGVYWTLVVMTTLGFGDITFATDVGRLFSIIVLISGVFFLLVMLPFLFIRLFYAPWLEARIRSRAPRAVAETTAGHVVITEYDEIAAALVGRLNAAAIPYFIVEPDPAIASRLMDDGLSVVAGERDNRVTYDQLRAGRARLVLANNDDRTNANITLTVRESSADVRVAAVVEDEESVDILQLSGATDVLPLKRRLGEYLANRAHTGQTGAHVIGMVRDVRLAEVPGRDTPFVGVTIRETRLRERTGLNIVGLWERGRLKPAFPDIVIQAESVIVVAGTLPQVDALNALLSPRAAGAAPPLAIVVGAGVVGRSAALALKRQGLRVHAIDREPRAAALLTDAVDLVVEGNAADRRFLERAGLSEAASVLLTANEDATNIYLALYCRRLKRDLRIVSRVTHERNVEAIHRAGADFALSFTSLGVDAVMSLLYGHETVLLGEGVELFTVPVPASLAGRRLRDSNIGAKTGLSVFALEQNGQLASELGADTVLPRGASVLMLGSVDQRRAFGEVFEGAKHAVAVGNHAGSESSRSATNSIDS